MATAFHGRQPSHPGAGAVDDTPTRPSSAAASFSSNLTSLKPPRTAHQHRKPSLSGISASRGVGTAAAGLANVDLNRLDARSARPSSRNSALKASDLDGLVGDYGLTAAATAADSGYIQADNTELARRRAEASFQREMEDLRNAAISPSSASDVSLGRKQHTAASRESDDDRRRRMQLDDETASSHSRTSASSYESFRIGLSAAPRPPPSGTGAGHWGAGARGRQESDDRDDDDDNLTYVTLARTDMTSPAKTATPGRPSPSAAAAPPHPPAAAAAATPATNLFASPRPFVTSAGAALSSGRATTSYPQSSSPGLPRRAYADENQPPAMANLNRPSPPRTNRPFSVAPLSTQPQQQQRASPFSAVNPALSTFRSAKKASPPPEPPALGAATPQSAVPHRPSPLGRNSPILAASPSAATSTPTGGSRSFVSRGGAMGMAAAADRTTMTALPDRTGITDFLRSPERERQIFERERQRATMATERGRSSEAQINGQHLGASTKTAESNLAAQALASLTGKLAALERDNAESASRVAELEARLAATAATTTGEARQGQLQEEEAARVRREVEILLGDERARREDLERVVSSLRAQNAHLDATLSAQKQTLDALRVSRSAAAAAAAAPAVATSPPGPYALRSEVQDLKHALAALGYEVDGVRTVVEELLREKEERDAGKRWEAEEAERRADLQAQAQAPAPGAPFARDDSIVGTPQSPLDHHLSPVEESVKSWVSREGIEMQKREQREAAGRHQYRRGAAKPSQPPHAARAGHVQNNFSELASSQDPTYVPSAVTVSSGELSEASFVSVTSATADSRSSLSSVDEPDFARAERIFAAAPRRPASTRQRSGRRSSGDHAGSKRRVDRVVLLDEPSANLCANCHGRKETLKRGPELRRVSHGSAGRGLGSRARDDGADADEEDLAPVDEARERRKRQHKADKARRDQERVEREARKERERKVREREEHRRTLEDVLDRLEQEFSVQKKIYLELTAEYQAMSSRAQTPKRRALATHLQKSIDVLEDKARDVKRYADALEDMYEAVHDQTCPQRNLHAAV